MICTYTENMLMLNGESSLNASEQKAIDEALINNQAVGVLIGRYDNALTIYTASDIFLKSIGYSIEEFAAVAPHSLLDLVLPADREKYFALDRFRALSGPFEFRGLNKAGDPVYIYAYKSESVGSNGEAQWTLSCRISHETVGMHQFIHGLSRLVARYVICDLETSTYSFFSCNEGETYLPQGTYSDFVTGMADQLGLTRELDDLTRMMAPESVRAALEKYDGLHRFDYADDKNNIYYRLSVMPLEYDATGELIKYLTLVMDVTETHRQEMRTQQALKDAYRAANKANDAKSNFLSSMSHDIRTPMNAIIGMTAIASAHIDDRERVLDSLGKITTSSRHLLGLINEVLDMSRIERGKMTLNNEDFSLPELVDNMIEMVKPSLIARNHEFDVRIQDIVHENVVGDSLRIQQVFTNIMGNAVKYTPDGGKIALCIREIPTHHANIGCYEFTVEDSGIGMSEEFLGHIFEPFARAENADAAGSQGTGLGMPIAKNIVSMMDGDIKVESELGHGTKVTVTVFMELQADSNTDDELLENLPVLVVDDDTLSCESTVDTLVSIGMQGEWVNNGPDAVTRVTERHQARDDFYAVILDWKMPGMDGIETARAIRGVVGPDIPIVMLTAYDFAEIETEARAAGINCFVSKPLFRSRLKNVFKHLVTGSSAAETPAATDRLPIGDYSGKRVLVVEDNMLNREIMVEILSETNIEVETAVNGKIAVDMVADAPAGYYDLVFMDIQMPVMNGYDATVAIRALANGKGATLPIVALTANAFAEDVIMAKNAGVNEHVAKPIEFDKLAEVMRTWIR